MCMCVCDMYNTKMTAIVEEVVPHLPLLPMFSTFRLSQGDDADLHVLEADSTMRTYRGSENFAA